MSEYLFCSFNGHLTQNLVAKVKREFPKVSVVNYREPGGEKRGWFAGPNRGEPFDSRLRADVVSFLSRVAEGNDRKRLERVLAAAGCS